MIVDQIDTLSYPPNIRTAFLSTEKLIKLHSKTFYFATALLPKNKRTAIRTLYAFCRATDDLVDQDGATLMDIQSWIDEVKLPVYDQTNPILLTWAVTREQYQISSRYEDELIQGVALDISKKTYATWEELENYCYLVAATVGLLSMPVIELQQGVRFEDAAPFAIKLGIALQLTNILRDVGEDARRGRVYFPQEDLARFDLNTTDILNNVYDDRFIDLMKFEIARAQALYEEALPGIALLSKAVRPAVGAAAILYREILKEIEGLNYQVYSYRAHTSGWKKLLMLPEIFLKVSFQQPPKI